MKNIISIGASNSKNSINKTLSTYAAKQMKDVSVTTLDLNDYDLPLYGVDLEETEGIPADAQKLSDAVEASDGIVISLAEHNGSFTVAFKNAVDWMSRIDAKLWKNKPMLLLATSPGGRGGMTVLKSATELYPRQGAQVVGSFSLPSFYDNFGEAGIKDAALQRELLKNVALLQAAL